MDLFSLGFRDGHRIFGLTLDDKAQAHRFPRFGHNLSSGLPLAFLRRRRVAQRALSKGARGGDGDCERDQVAIEFHVG